MRGRELTALTMLAVIGVVTVAWWALALWPLPDEAPAWLARTRWVCFGAAPRGLPNGGGWLLLIGQPLMTLGALFLVWGDAVRDGARVMWQRPAGRGVAGLAVVGVVVGLTAATVRVVSARGLGNAGPAPESASAFPRLERAAPPLVLTDQTGATFDLARLAGRPAVVLFAFAHCETVCPLMVHDALRLSELVPERPPAVVIVTVDPWRDTPARLPAIARQWDLPPGAAVLSGEPADVERVLAAWDVVIQRDPGTGDITHPTTVYILDSAGRIAFAASGDAELLAELVRRL